MIGCVGPKNQNRHVFITQVVTFVKEHVDRLQKEVGFKRHQNSR